MSWDVCPENCLGQRLYAMYSLAFIILNGIFHVFVSIAKIQITATQWGSKIAALVFSNVCCVHYGCSQISLHRRRKHDAPLTSMWVNLHVPFNVVTMSRNPLSLLFSGTIIYFLSRFICSQSASA